MESKDINDTGYLLNIPGLKEELLKGAKEPIEDCKTAEEIGWDI